MISQEMADKLCNIMPWKPLKEGDWFYYQGRMECATPGKMNWLIDCHDEGYEAEVLFAPRLDQLLGMIEQEGYIPNLDSLYATNTKQVLYDASLYVIQGGEPVYLSQADEEADLPEDGFISETREDACAKALLWIYEQKKGGGDNAGSKA